MWLDHGLTFQARSDPSVQSTDLAKLASSPRCPECGILVGSHADWAWEDDQRVPARNGYWLAEHRRWHGYHVMAAPVPTCSVKSASTPC